MGGDRIRRIYATGDAAIASMCPNLLQNAPKLAPEETNDRDDGDKLVAASRTLIKAIETGQSAGRLADVIMIDRNAAAAAEIATLRLELTAAKARIQETGRQNAAETEHFRAICRRIDDWVGIMTHTDATRALAPGAK